LATRLKRLTNHLITFHSLLPPLSRASAPIGSDLRPCSALETLGIGFLVPGPLIYCLKTKVSEDDPIWTVLRSTGTEDVDSSSQRSGGDYSG
jgi:hypothetical protein